MRILFKITCILLFLIMPSMISAQVKIGEDHTAPHEGAMLELSGTDKGLLYPRVVLTNSTSWAPLTGTATEGMQVFNTGASTANGLGGAGVYIWMDNAWRLVLNNNAAITAIATDVTNTMNTKFGAIGTTFNVVGTDSKTYRIVVAKDGRAWTQQNLGANSVATSVTDAANYGDLYQWGRRNDGHQLRNSGVTTAPSYNPATFKTMPDFKNFVINWWQNHSTTTSTASAYSLAQTTSNTGCDPCKMILGRQWRLPSYAEWSAMIQAEGITLPISSAYSSSLKLTASGKRDQASGSIIDVGSMGYYWAGDKASGASANSLALDFGHVSSLGVQTSVANAMAIRCINILK